jgi:hypothetical protein
MASGNGVKESSRIQKQGLRLPDCCEVIYSLLDMAFRNYIRAELE